METLLFREMGKVSLLALEEKLSGHLCGAKELVLRAKWALHAKLCYNFTVANFAMCREYLRRIGGADCG